MSYGYKYDKKIFLLMKIFLVLVKYTFKKIKIKQALKKINKKI